MTQAKGPTQGQKKARMQVLTHDKLAKTNIIFTSRTNANIMFGSRTNALIVASYWLPKGNLTCTSHMHCRRFGWPICMYLTFAYFPQNPRKRGSCESGREEER